MNTDAQRVATLISSGELQKAQNDVTAWLAREPASAEAWYLNGVIASRLDHSDTAISYFNRALQYRPNFKEAALGLGRMLGKTGQLQLAIRVFEHLLTIECMSGEKKPPAPKVDMKAVDKWLRKGDAYQKQGDAKSAADAFRQVLSLWPDMPEALTNLGFALYTMREHGETEAVLLHALRVHPNSAVNATALNLLATNYAVSGEPLRAIAIWRYMIATQPEQYDALVNLAKAYSGLKLYGESVDTYDKALVLRPQSAELLMELLHMLHCLCRWDRVGEITVRLKASLAKKRQWMTPFMVTVHLPEYQLQNNRIYAKQFFPAQLAYDMHRPLPADTRGDKKLRIGYLSSDFHAHATAYLISELFELHDKERFDIIAYSYDKVAPCPERQRIANAVSVFRDIRDMDNVAAANLIRQDGIDILVDLKNYMSGSRIGLMATRPAPIQMHYLGHPGTTGAAFIDYFIADAIAAPHGEDAEFCECLIRVPHSYQINDRKRPLPQTVQPRGAYGLPENAFVFCDFNSTHKITPDIFAIWLRLLKAVEDSVLWLYETTAEATQNMRTLAQQQGIDPARIITAKAVPLAEHLMRYLHVDLMLDTLPYNGHTTTSDALWCGVPVVTIAGEHFVSRVAASLLHAVGLPELVTSTSEDYEKLALEIAHDKERLQRLKTYLQNGRMSFPLFDSPTTTKAIESAYQEVAKRHRSGTRPSAFTFPLTGGPLAQQDT